MRYVRGLTDALAFEGNLGVLIPVGRQLSLGLRYRLLKLDGLSLALHGGVATGKIFAEPGGDPSSSLGGSAGLTMSMGGRRAQLSIEVEASYLSFRPTAPGSNARQLFVLLPTLNLERNLQASELILRVGALASGEEGARPIGVPMVAAGLAW